MRGVVARGQHHPVEQVFHGVRGPRHQADLAAVLAGVGLHRDVLLVRLQLGQDRQQGERLQRAGRLEPLVWVLRGQDVPGRRVGDHPGLRVVLRRRRGTAGQVDDDHAHLAEPAAADDTRGRRVRGSAPPARPGRGSRRRRGRPGKRTGCGAVGGGSAAAWRLRGYLRATLGRERHHAAVGVASVAAFSCKITRVDFVQDRGDGPSVIMHESRGQTRRNEQRPLDLLDRLGDLDAARAGVGAVEGRPAAPDALLVVQDLQPLLGALVAAVEDEPVGVDDRGRAEVLAVVPEDRARAWCRHAQRMHLVVSSKRARSSARLQALAGGRRCRSVIRNGMHLAVRREERLHVDDEVLLQRQALDRLDDDRLARVQVLDQGLAGQPVAPVDPHRVRPADAVRARAPEGQRAVLLPLDLVQRVEHPVGREARRRVKSCQYGSASTRPG